MLLTGLLFYLFSTIPVQCNQPPQLITDMNALILNESIPVGTIVFKLAGVDPENSPVRYGIQGTDKLTVDAETGEVRLTKSLDYEKEQEIKAVVVLEDKVDSTGGNNLNDESNDNNVVRVPVSVIITDVNDNPPMFINGPYIVDVNEDVEKGSTIFKDVRVLDPDTVGEELSVTCSSKSVPTETCDVFTVLPVSSNESSYHGVVVLNRFLDFTKRSSYQMILLATDGAMESRVELYIRVQDVQNTPPIFTTSLVAVVREDAEIGTRVMTVHARDGDTGHPREVQYELVTNPMDYFLIDTKLGDLIVAKHLDKEATANGIVKLQIRAYEVLPTGMRVSEDEAMKSAELTITIQDVNDEPPRFNQREFSVEIPENLAADTPLPRLDMTVTDPDVGANSAFTLRLADGNDLFAVTPTNATGATSVSIKVVNGSLDYENPNQRKFIIRVIAEEDNTKERHSSTATVTVMITDTNDNAPYFTQNDYSATVNEAASGGSFVTAITANDRDSGQFGASSIYYYLDGIDASRFVVDRFTGSISVASCDTPGKHPCLDLETKPEYHFTYTARDDEGKGLSVQVPLRISLQDANDNPPHMAQSRFTTSVEEGAQELQPPLYVSATDPDNTSEITYNVVEGNQLDLFNVDPHSGLILIKRPPLDLTNLNTTMVNLIIEASDGEFSDTATVSIFIKDVNNNAPEFSQKLYLSSVNEDAPIGTQVIKLWAHDGDSGENADVHYQIHSGSFNDFNLDNITGWVTVASQLDYDRHNRYSINVLAVDGGVPPQTGSSEIKISVINSNDKAPMFLPVTQRANVTEAAKIGTIIYMLKAYDLDAVQNSLHYEVAEPISAIDAGGHAVQNHKVKEWFKVDTATGAIFVANKLERQIAAVVTLTVIVTDSSAPALQQGKGTLIVSIIDVNDHSPIFLPPWTALNPTYQLSVMEGWSESPVATFTATDEDSAIAYYEINPPSDSFSINNVTGVVRLLKALDYEKEPIVHFTVWAFDTGIPQLNSSALVTVNVTNVNDNDPVFTQHLYQAAVVEDALPETIVTTVTAHDLDIGVFGEVVYSLVGAHAQHFTVDPKTGVIRVLNPVILDREERQKINLEVVASDSGPTETRRTATAMVEITILDVNDNGPVFSSPVYPASVMENIGLTTHIVQPHADDPDFGVNGTVTYAIVNGNTGDVFRIHPTSGIVYPAKSLRGAAREFALVVEARDGGHRTAQTHVQITVQDVNENRPVFVNPNSANATKVIPESMANRDFLVMTVQAKDLDSGENGHVSYHFKVNNTNAQQTNEFTLDPETGELRLKTALDRETNAKFDVVLVAKDHGTFVSYETLQLLSIVLLDENDNEPAFKTHLYEFSVTENNAIGIEIGRVRAIDVDEGQHARIFYTIIEGNEEHRFKLDRLSGVIYANASFDREVVESYTMFIKASNQPEVDFSMKKSMKRDVDKDTSIVRVRIEILDENDNPPRFPITDYYVGVKSMSVLGELLTQVAAVDPDKEQNGALDYLIQASNLFKEGSLVSSGSVIPSPFNVTQEGKVITAAVMAEYAQDRFQLVVLARERAAPNRVAQATVHVWVYEPHQLIRVVLSRSPEEVHRDSRGIVEELSNATKSLVVVDDVRYHVDGQKHIHRDWTDMYLHVVDRNTQIIQDTMQVLKTMDAQYDFLKDRYLGFAIENILPAVEEVKEETFDTALAALVALLIVLFVGCVTFLVVCCCLRNWVLALPGKDSLKKKDALIKQAILEDLHTTENPLWMEQKLKLYEEQELTMQVFIDELRQAEDSASQHDENTYATIQHPHHNEDISDYETLTAHRHEPHGSVRGRSQSVQLGFHGSTFQPPLL